MSFRHPNLSLTRQIIIVMRLKDIDLQSGIEKNAVDLLHSSLMHWQQPYSFNDIIAYELVFFGECLSKDTTIVDEN